MRSGVDAAVFASGQVEVLPVSQLHAATGGARVALRDAHLSALARTHRDGYRALSMTSDGAALHAAVPEPGELLAHEQDLNQMVDRHPLRVLCRYDPGDEQLDFLEHLFGLHYRNVQSDAWTAVGSGDHLRVAGEIDAAAAGQLRAVLYAAIRDGTTGVDIADVRYLSAAGVSVLFAAADLLSGSGAALTLLNPSYRIGRVLGRLDVERHPAIRIAGKEAGQ